MLGIRHDDIGFRHFDSHAHSSELAPQYLDTALRLRAAIQLAQFFLYVLTCHFESIAMRPDLIRNLECRGHQQRRRQYEKNSLPKQYGMLGRTRPSVRGRLQKAGTPHADQPECNRPDNPEFDQRLQDLDERSARQEALKSADRGDT